jgi:hypothetical protein
MLRALASRARDATEPRAAYSDLIVIREHAPDFDQLAVTATRTVT